MARGWLLGLGICLAALIGCSNDGSDSQPAGDGGHVEGGAGGGDVNPCPPATTPGIHYYSMDTTVCGTTVLTCTTAQNGFQNQCGCGCIDKGTDLCMVFDPSITWVSMDPSQCGSMLPACPPDDTPFNNSCGCGCVAH